LGVGRTLAIKAISLSIVLLAVLFLTVAALGATGLSDQMLNAIMNENLRAIRQSLALSISDPDALNAAMEEIEAELIVSYGLDQPWYVRMPNMAYRIITLDLGNSRTVLSFTGSIRISDIVLERMPNTILLMVTVLIISFALGLVFGTYVATKPGSLVDRFVSLYSATSYAVPTWWLGMIMILVFAFYFRIFPYGGMYSAPVPTGYFAQILDLLWHAALPIITLVLALSGAWIYTIRSTVITTAQEDFVTTARAKGLPERLVMWRHIIRVAASPILTNLILGLAGYLGGAILTETVFGWPGMGQLYWQSILSIDERLILALTYVYTLIYVVSRFVLEVLYVVLDPRVRTE
jgi:peptide/nickel transport system permease protein